MFLVTRKTQVENDFVKHRRTWQMRIGWICPLFRQD